jgi:hypothetical protein
MFGKKDRTIFKEETEFSGSDICKKFFINDKAVSEDSFRVIYKNRVFGNVQPEKKQADNELMDYQPMVVAMVTSIEGKNSFEIAAMLDEQFRNIANIYTLEGRKQALTEIGMQLIRASGEIQGEIRKLTEGEDLDG